MTHKHEWVSKPDYPEAGLFCRDCFKPKPVRLCTCRCGCRQEAVYGRPPFLCKACWKQADADNTGPHGPGEAKG